MSKTFRRPLFAFTLGAALAAAVLLGRAAYADNGTINACFKPSNGTLYLLDASSRTVCQPGDIPISWNAAGLQGPPGPPGPPGEDGEDGEPFSGTFASPNGQYSLTVADDGIRLLGPNGRLDLVAGGITIDSQLGLTLRGTTAAALLSSGSVTVQGAGQVAVNGALVNLNGGACTLLRPTDVAISVGPDGGQVLLNPAGTLTVRTGC